MQVVTSSTSAVDVHASFMDYNGTVVTPGRKNTAIASATTTSVVLSPASAVQRNVKLLTAKNKGGAPNTVTIQHTDGSTTVEMHSVTLAPGETLQYNDEFGFLVL